MVTITIHLTWFRTLIKCANEESPALQQKNVNISAKLTNLDTIHLVLS